MGIPTVSALLTPFLKLCGDKEEHSIQEAIESLSRLFRLSTDDRRKLLPSGGDLIFSNRVAWAQTILKHSRLIESVRRGYFRITDRGAGALSQNVTINNTFLKQFPEYLKFIRLRGEKNGVEKSMSMAATDSGSYSTSPLDRDKVYSHLKKYFIRCK